MTRKIRIIHSVPLAGNFLLASRCRGTLCSYPHLLAHPKCRSPGFKSLPGLLESGLAGGSAYATHH